MATGLSAAIDSDASDPEFQLDPDLRASDPKIREAIAYWQAKRGHRLAPARSEIHAREITNFLPHLQIFEVIGGGRTYRPRLIGTEIVSQIEEDTTGQIFDESSTRLVVHRVLRAIRWVVEHKKPLRTFTRRTAVETREFLTHETVFLPLSSNGETIDMMAVVGVFAPAQT